MVLTALVWGFGAYAQTALAPEYQAIMDRYETCIDDARSRTREVGNVVLRPRFFDALSGQCNRQRDAELSVARSEAGIAAAQVDQAALEAEIAALTDSLIMGARSDLGLPISE